MNMNETTKVLTDTELENIAGGMLDPETGYHVPTCSPYASGGIHVWCH